MCGMYQRFISQYQVRTEPLRLFKKRNVFICYVWTANQQRAFEDLKHQILLLPTLLYRM
jgi:hypothetical protein